MRAQPRSGLPAQRFQHAHADVVLTDGHCLAHATELVATPLLATEDIPQIFRTVLVGRRDEHRSYGGDEERQTAGTEVGGIVVLMIFYSGGSCFSVLGHNLSNE